MGILEQIKKDHEEVTEIFEKLMKTGGEKTRQNYFDKLREELIPHMEAEEAVLFPELKDGDGKEKVLEGIEEHRASQLVLKEIEKTGTGDERWPAKVKVLHELVEHHHEEEEKEIFKEARSALSKEQMKELGDKFDSKKEQAKKKM
jgi:hemerythrin superfamily protein